jgi:hypothetical protein
MATFVVSSVGNFLQVAKMQRRVWLLAVVLPGCLVLLGCEPPPPVAQNNAASPAPPPPPGAAVPPPATETPPPPETETVKAEQGVGIKGRSLDEYEGVVVTPVKTLFAVKENLVFTNQIPKALQLFNATEGRNPMSHEEFMEKIVQANNIRLPELAEGHRYLYDPTTNELMVERPKKKGE